MPRITSFHFGTSGTYMGSGFDYDYDCDTADGRGVISIRIEGVREEDALKLDADEGFAEELERIIAEYGLRKWDGFSKSDQNVLDGSSFGFSVRYDDKSSISAHGYMRYPKNYAEVNSAFDGLFLPLYEAVRPDKRKVMARYFDEVILKDRPAMERQEVRYPYISDGGNMYCLGVCECTGGAAMYTVYDCDDEPSYMLVVALDRKDNRWELSCEMYRITGKGEVLPWGSTLIDGSFFSSERLYGHIFTREYNGQLQLGCFIQKGFSASGRDTKYYIDLYDIGEKLKPLASEKIEGPANNKEWWTPDKLARFNETADKYGFVQSKQHWTEMPNDPVFAGGMRDNANKRFNFLLTNNHDSRFYNTLLETPKGERVGEYLVKGTLYVH
ncbi:MAG: hypothetical protein IKO27_05670 [Ruminococcus sp.]|nr:hypothetical protein [Ruminococcus sp.]